MSKSIVGVVGGSGYIGSAIANHLSNTFKVKVIDKVPPSSRLQSKVGYEECNILKPKEVDRALSGLDLVIHTAIVQIPLIVENKKLGYGVNFLGTQNLCRAIAQSSSIKGMILSGTWHVFGERELSGVIDEAFGFRPDKIESRARLYALSKIAQEVIVRYYDEMSKKTFGVIRMATVLGVGMPEKTAANIFISKGLAGEAITPFKHSMYRPMLYVDIMDVCKAFRVYAMKILSGQIPKGENSLAHVVNLCWPKPMTIFDLAHLVRNTIIGITNGSIKPEIEVVDRKQPVLYQAGDKQKVKVDIGKIQQLLDIKKLKDPRESIERIVMSEYKRAKQA